MEHFVRGSALVISGALVELFRSNLQDSPAKGARQQAVCEDLIHCAVTECAACEAIPECTVEREASGWRTFWVEAGYSSGWWLEGALALLSLLIICVACGCRSRSEEDFEFETLELHRDGAGYAESRLGEARGQRAR